PPRGAMSRSTTATISPHRSAPGQATTTYRSSFLSEVDSSGKGPSQQAGAQAREAQRNREHPAQAVPALPRQDRAGRLQGRRDAAQVHLREGQDPLTADHGGLPPPPGPDRARGQARAGAGAAAVRQRGRTRRQSASRARRPRPRSLTARSRGMPEAILLQDVETLGAQGAVVD